MSLKSFSPIVLSGLFCLLVSLPARSDSQVRIVRLSYLEGQVTIDRGTGQYEKAMINLPITEGARLRTADGRAEVEFEDGSTIRLAPRSAVQFPRLALRDSGQKISAVEVAEGTAYVSFAGSKNAELTIQIGDQNIVLARSAHLRVRINNPRAEVAVFKGDVEINGPSGALEVKKNQTANLDLSDEARSAIAKNIEPLDFDSWDKEQDQYHSRYSSSPYGNYSPYRYGGSDLAYYGNFFSVPGYGMMWQPYFTGIGWDPFMDGAWLFHPGWGYGWVSAYPWGWLPYHYGNWVFMSGYGWAWQPGGVWMPWYRQPQLVNAPSGFVVPRAPAAGTNTLVVNRGPAAMTGQKTGSLVIRNNSAGLGVPRGQSNNLAGLSQKVEKRGVATERINGGTAGPGPSSRGENRHPSFSGEPMRSAPPSAPPAHTSSSSQPHR
ncbi:MAG: FecR domain-containing protein [Acidobacteria bacterium]|nr:FecR domain-containing protein [Acidobacteriota bacterium]